MNAMERYRAVIEGQPVDTLPRLPILMAFAAHFVDSNYRAFASDFRVLVEANLRCLEHFGFEQVSAISDPFRETQGFGAEITFPEDSVPRCVKPPLEDDKNLDPLAVPEPYRSERMLDRMRAVEALHRAVGATHSVLGWVEGPAAEAADLRGVTNFLTDLIADPEYAAALMDRCLDTGIEFAVAQVRAGADTIGIGDAIASQISPDMYRQFVLPRERALVDAIHQEGGLVRLHICGDTTHLLEGFAELGCDIVDLDWQVDLGRARELLGPAQTLLTNLDPVRAVQNGTPDSIRSQVRELYAAVGNPLMVGAGCEIPPGTPNEHLEALCAPVSYAANPGGTE